ncbi:MAG: Holliday junction branch migration protein RuvA [Bacteroidales bacterium]|nr:Holliday junction branch migration protein RuvA [Bacteroidales bacterium]MBN2755927.1 Holliday junction branch migration protein RuvA [Bacteroidales bacterium]
MFEYIKGIIIESTPTYVVIENSGIAYFVNISLNTYSQIKENDEKKFFIHQVIREDANLLFGFIEKSERELFRMLITVSGVGANTARMMLSSISTNEIKNAIIQGKVNTLQSIKGIGIKTAQRIIIDLKDKIVKVSESNIMVPELNINREEALSALIMLGFNKAAVEKNLDKILNQNQNLKVEEIIKIALKQL